MVSSSIEHRATAACIKSLFSTDEIDLVLSGFQSY